MTQQRPTHNVKINGNSFTIRQILPIDFIGRGCPLSFFLIDTPKTNYELMKELMDKHDNEAQAENNKQELDAMKSILGAGVVECNGIPFDVETYFQESTDLIAAIELVGRVLSLSFTILRPIQLDRAEVESIDKLAKRYGKTPAEIMWPSGGCTPLDAYTFNMAVGGIGISSQISYVNANKVQVVHVL